MTTQTTDSQISAMKAMAAILESDGTVNAAHIDDWGRYGNFTLMVTPREHDRYTTNRLKALVRKHMPKGAHLRECFAPDPIRETYYRGVTKIVGYSRSFWTFDVDYQHYDAGSNSFI